MLIFALNGTASGAFSLRLKQGSSNLLTNTYTISTSAPSAGVTYTAYMPNTIRRGEETAITLQISGLAANGKVSDLKVGSYLTGGTQIAVFSLDGVTWSTSYGYSSAFEMTADANGVATKTILMRVNDTVTDTSATFRIKCGSANKLTQAYSLE